MTEKLLGILWDMDGVLVDTGTLHFLSWSETLSEHGISFSQEQFRVTFGMNNAGIIETLLGRRPDPDLFVAISDRKEQLFRKAIKGQVRPLPGVVEWLDWLRERGFKQAIASSAPLANIDALVDELGIRLYFAAIVSGFDLPGKPDPAVFLEAARRIGVSPERCMVFEDAIAGVKAAKRAGMRCVAVTTTNPAHQLQEADLIVEGLDVFALDRFVQLVKDG